MIEIIANDKVIINNKLIDFECQIEKIIEYEQLYVVMLQYDYYPGNNIVAYNDSGEKIWSVDEVISLPRVQAYVSMGKVSNELLGMITYSGVRYIVNVYSLEIVCKEITK